MKIIPLFKDKKYIIIFADYKNIIKKGNLLRFLLCFFLISLVTILNADNLYPLYKNAIWTYTVNDGNKTYKRVNKVVDEKKIQGKIWFKSLENDVVLWIRNSDEGQVEAKDYTDKDATLNKKPKEIVSFKYPAKVGEKWPYYDDEIIYQGTKNINVPAGKFICHMYIILSEGAIYNKLCVAKDVGIVYTELYLGGNEKEISKLTSYKLK